MQFCIWFAGHWVERSHVKITGISQIAYLHVPWLIRTQQDKALHLSLWQPGPAGGPVPRCASPCPASRLWSAAQCPSDGQEWLRFGPPLERAVRRGLVGGCQHSPLQSEVSNILPLTGVSLFCAQVLFLHKWTMSDWTVGRPIFGRTFIS